MGLDTRIFEPDQYGGAPLLELARALPVEIAATFQTYGLVMVIARLDAMPDWLPTSTATDQAGAEQRFPRKGQAGKAGYLARRRILRGMVQAVTGVSADPIEFGATPDGAPLLMSDEVAGLHVSFAARGDSAIVALATSPVGVDIEVAVRRSEIPWNILTEAERTRLDSLPSDAQPDAFARLWSLKEATVKALGRGFHLPPEDIEIRWLDPAPVLSLRTKPENNTLGGATILTWRQTWRFNADHWGVGDAADGHAAIFISAVCLDTN